MVPRRNILPWALFTASFLMNLVFAGWLLLDKLNAPPNRVGVLTRDVEIGSFSDSKVLFMLPKGTTVRDASPRFLEAIDLFEPNRFSIIFTTEDEQIVNYEAPRSARHGHEEYYSLDIAERKEDSSGAPEGGPTPPLQPTSTAALSR
jgi:hypothetical protein